MTDTTSTAAADGQSYYLLDQPDMIYPSLDDYGAAPHDYLTASAEPASFGPLDPESGVQEQYRDLAVIVPLADLEHRQIRVGSQALEAELMRISRRLEEDRELWERAKARATEDFTHARARYAPLEQLLRQRSAEVLAGQAAAREMEEHRAQERAAAAQAAEDAELGPRDFVVRRPRDTGQHSSEMDVPTVHLATCGTLKDARESGPSSRRVQWRLVRAAEAFEALMDGATRRRKRLSAWDKDPDGERLEGKVCRSCKPGERLAEVAPETYAAWEARMDAVQPKTAPTAAALIRDLGKVGVRVQKFASRPDMWAEARLWAENLRRDGLLAPYETVIGYLVQPEGESSPVWADGVLERLPELAPLAARAGLAVRAVQRPVQTWEEAQRKAEGLEDTPLSEYYLAVRRMTRAEIKRERETRAA